MFLLNETKFVERFRAYEIGRHINKKTNISNHYQAASKSILASHLFTVTPQASGVHYISIDTWYPRMYQLGCLSGLSRIRLSVVNLSDE
jgi:hypothetical protein